MDEVIGQERAVQAIEFGLNMKDPGYNIFVTGMGGTGKSTIVKDLVTKHASALPTPADWCLVNDFKDVFRPKAIGISPGKAVSFCKKMNRVIEDLKKELPKALESESYLKKLTKIKNKCAEEKSAHFHQLEEFAAARGFKIERIETDFQTVPIVNGEPITSEAFHNLPEGAKSKIEVNMRIVQAEIDTKARETDRIDQALHVDIEKLLDEVALSAVKTRMDSVREEFGKVQPGPS